MKQAFLIVGYGIPKDIMVDENYDRYLRSAFNLIFDRCVKSHSWDATIIFSGGRTDMLAPYRRTEAAEMKRCFAALCARESVKDRTRGWKLVLEAKAISSLDNVLYAKSILQARAWRGPVTVFCEQTRVRRLQKLARAVLGKAAVVPIDFDQSANRYLDPTFMAQKEKRALAFDLWALKGPKNLLEHRSLFKRRLAFLREAGSENHVEAVKAWWEEELRKVGRER